jgi:gamma-glutamylcyclotransferase (GGCT)/AIG2-like uncharacterized protein YtfP
MKCFAYGSNMCTGRLRYRVPHCKAITTATLRKHTLRFHKRSQDGSGKCNAFYTGSEIDNVIGVVFEIPQNEKPALDEAEGLGHGYHEEDVTVFASDETPLEVKIYVADNGAVDNTLVPYTWYKDFVRSGADEYHLPKDYIDKFITPVQAQPDPRPGRDKRERAKFR